MQFRTPEQNSKRLQAAQKFLATTQDRHAECLKQMQTLRAKLHSLHAPQMPNDPEQARERKQAIGKARAELDNAIAKRDELRAALEEAKQAEREEAQRACIELVDSASKDYGAAFRRFIVARLESIADEAAALAEVSAIRYGLQVALGVRRDHRIARLPQGFQMHTRAEEFERLRTETRELVSAGVISAKDVPQALRRSWNL